MIDNFHKWGQEIFGYFSLTILTKFDNFYYFWQFWQFFEVWQFWLYWQSWWPVTFETLIFWKPEFMTIFVTWQLRVTLDSIRNYCDVYYYYSVWVSGGCIWCPLSENYQLYYRSSKQPTTFWNLSHIFSNSVFNPTENQNERQPYWYAKFL